MIPTPGANIRVGDTVKIVAAKGCRYGYDRTMSNYIGQEAVVKSIRWSAAVKSQVFTLDIDKGKYAWCDKCIELAEELEIEESDKTLDTLFGV